MASKKMSFKGALRVVYVDGAEWVRLLLSAVLLGLGAWVAPAVVPHSLVSIVVALAVVCVALPPVLAVALWHASNHWRPSLKEGSDQ